MPGYINIVSAYRQVILVCVDEGIADILLEARPFLEVPLETDPSLDSGAGSVVRAS